MSGFRRTLGPFRPTYLRPPSEGRGAPMRSPAGSRGGEGIPQAEVETLLREANAEAIGEGLSQEEIDMLLREAVR